MAKGVVPRQFLLAGIDWELYKFLVLYPGLIDDAANCRNSAAMSTADVNAMTLPSMFQVLPENFAHSI